MRIGSLFSGYGGADLAVQSVFPDATPAWFVEYDKHPSTILAKAVPRGEELRGRDHRGLGRRLRGMPVSVTHPAGRPIIHNAQLKALGNGIVWQQMALALRLLLAEEVAV